MGKKKDIENLNWELLAKLATDENKNHKDSEVESWLSQSEKNREELEESKKMLDKVDDFYKMKNFNSHEAWKSVQSKIHPKKAKTIQLKNIRKEATAKFYKYAAIVLIALLVGSIGYYIGFVVHT